jgi:hypothetical protein
MMNSTLSCFVYAALTYLQVHNALRRERDALSAEVDSLKHQLGVTQQERDELAAKVRKEGHVLCRTGTGVVQSWY